MKHILFISFFLLFWNKYHRIYEINTLKEEAASYYQERKYNECIQTYEKLINGYDETDENIKLNLANCYCKIGKDKSALEKYKVLSNSLDLKIKSIAFLQLGILYTAIDKKELGLNYYKYSLKANPENESARYNYELLKKELERKNLDQNVEKKKENANGQYKMNVSTTEEFKNATNPDGKSSNQEENNQDFDDEGSGDVGEDELQYNISGDLETDALTSKRLQEVNMSEQQARIILNTMRNSEIQYIQQRKKVITTKPNPGKPTW